MKITVQELFDRFGYLFDSIQYTVATERNDEGISVVTRGTGTEMIINNDPDGELFDCDYDYEAHNGFKHQYADYEVLDFFYEEHGNKMWLCLYKAVE